MFPRVKSTRKNPEFDSVRGRGGITQNWQCPVCSFDGNMDHYNADYDHAFFCKKPGCNFFCLARPFQIMQHQIRCNRPRPEVAEAKEVDDNDDEEVAILLQQ